MGGDLDPEDGCLSIHSAVEASGGNARPLPPLLALRTWV
jgi:hypothetical protein